MTNSTRFYEGTTSEGLPCEMASEYLPGFNKPFRITGSYFSFDSLDDEGRKVASSFDVQSELHLPQVVFQGDWKCVGGHGQ